MNSLDQELQDLENELRAMSPSPLSKELNDQTAVQLFGADLAKLKPAELTTTQLDSLEDILVESELLSMTPRAVDKSFLDQLEHIPTEVALTELQPAPLSDEFLNRVAYKLDNLDAQDVKVIPFPSKPQQRTKNWKWYTSAAAAACIGIFSGLTFTQEDAPSFTDNNPTNSSTFLSSDNLQNVSTESTLIQAENKGIIHSRHQELSPYRAVRIIEVETQTLKTASGDIIKVQRPVEKIIRVPVEAD